MNGEILNNSDNSGQTNGEEWQALAEQIASHTTVNGKGESVYLGRELPKSARI